jgi:predicted RNA-binding Zn ribbon-like protein
VIGERAGTRPGLGDEDLLIAVANTGHGDHDEFADRHAAAAWLHDLGAAPAGAERASDPGPQDLERLRALRALIRRLALRNNGIDTYVDTSALDTLALHPDLTGAPTLRAAQAGDPVADLCAAAIAALLRACARPGWPRFKACRGEDCRWVFTDQSRNTSRRWCDMAACGNRAKSETFRARHTSTTPG